MKKRFRGSLERIMPGNLINDADSNKTESFFLVLGLIFNDLKGVLQFEEMLRSQYEPPDKDEVSDHAGNYGGLLIQIQRLYASILNELLKLINSSGDVFNEYEYKQIIKKMTNSKRLLWEALIDFANTDTTKHPMLKILCRIRHQFTFHYYQAADPLRKAYTSLFFGDTDHERTKFAYYSIGEMVEQTRFYFSDAAVEEAMQLITGKKNKENSVGHKAFMDYQARLNEAIVNICVTIAMIMKDFIAYRRNLPRKK